MDQTAFVIILLIIIVVIIVAMVMMHKANKKRTDLILALMSGADGTSVKADADAKANADAKADADIEAISGSGDSLSENIVDKLNTYIKETAPTGERNLIDYLFKYYDYGARANVMRKDARGDRILLGVLVEDICQKHDIRDLEDFISKSDITYGKLLSPDKQAIVNNPQSYTKRSLGGLVASKVKEMSKLLTAYLEADYVYLSKDKIRKHMERFLLFNRLFKLRHPGATVAAIKKQIATSPEKALDMDYIALLPRIKNYAKTIQENKKEKTALDRITKELKRMNLGKYYPEFTIRHISSVDELADEIRRAADRIVASPRREEALLRELEHSRLERRPVVAPPAAVAPVPPVPPVVVEEIVIPQWAIDTGVADTYREARLAGVSAAELETTRFGGDEAIKKLIDVARSV